MKMYVMVVGVSAVVASSAGAAAPAQREAEVKAVYFARDGERARGGTTKVIIRLSPNKSRAPSVGVMEEFAGGTGDQWRTALWQASFVATQATNTSLLDYEFLLRVGGHIDGPSAGLLTAATLTALIRNKKLLPATTMTGTINPDGSSGPVGGIEVKMRGAAADGIKRFGFPIGARQQVSAKSGDTTDLLAVAQELGIEAKELRDLDDAYLFLTGDTLPRPVPVAETEMEISLDEMGKLKGMVQRIRAEISAGLPELESALKKVGEPAAASMKKVVMDAAIEADAASDSGDFISALFAYARTLTNIHIMTERAQLRTAFLASDFDTVNTLTQKLETAVPLQRASLRSEIASQFPPTGRLNDIWAMDIMESTVGIEGQLLGARIRKQQLTDLHQRTKTLSADDRKLTLKLLMQYCGELRGVLDEYENGRRFMSVYASLPPLKRAKPPADAIALAAAYVSAGSASRAYFEAVVTQPTAQAAGIAQDQLQGFLIEKDQRYLDLLAYGQLLSTEKDARARLLLAQRQTLFSAALVNTYYALGAQVDPNGTLTLKNPRALTAQLALAQRRTLEACGRASREFGLIPLPARIRYQSAMREREGTDNRKTDALVDLWLASSWCNFAVSK